MQDFLYSVLKEKIGDAKVTIDGQEKELLPIVVDWEEGLGKVKTANADLVSQRERWEQDRRQLKQERDDATNAKNEAEAKLNDKDSKTSKKSAEFEELQKQFNSLNEKLASVTSQYETTQSELREAKEKSHKATMQSENQRLRNDVLNELGKHKITGNQAQAALAMIEAKGNAKVIETDDGFSRSFSTTKDGKELAASLESLCKTFAEENQFLVSSSGNSGSGKDHENTSHGGGGIPGFTGQETTKDLRNKFRDMMNPTKQT